MGSKVRRQGLALRGIGHALPDCSASGVGRRRTRPLSPHTRRTSTPCLPMPPHAKRLLAVLLRESCVSVAWGSQQSQQVQPLGAVMLRDGGKLPSRAFARLLAACKGGELEGAVLGMYARRGLVCTCN